MHCHYCEADTIAGAQMVQDGGAIKIMDCCTSCGKPYRQQRDVDSMPEAAPQPKAEAKPAPLSQTQAKVVAHPSSTTTADALLEQARARLAQVDAELGRMAQLKRERTMLRRIVKATDTNK